MVKLSVIALVSALVAEARDTAWVLRENAFIVKLSTKSSSSGQLPKAHEHFHKRAAESSLRYTVRHEYDDPEVLVGLSVRVHNSESHESALLQLRSIPGVEDVSAVYDIYLDDPYERNLTRPTEPVVIKAARKGPPVASITPGQDANLASTHQMGGVDKLHALGIKGKGIKIGVVDTGVDYRHPALGGGFGPGFKIAGGHAFVDDDGKPVDKPDPLETCTRGGHGTHVSGILSMDPLDATQGLNITGVAPEASLYMYRAFSCEGKGGSDDIQKGMIKAKADGVDIISMSLSIGVQTMSDAGDPLASTVAALYDAGIAVFAAGGNGASPSQYSSEVFRSVMPSEQPKSIGVGSVANKDFPLVFTTQDNSAAAIPYAATWPINLPEGADLYFVEFPCVRDSWNEAVAFINEKGLLNSTVFGAKIDNNCRPSGTTLCCVDEILPQNVLAVYTPEANNIYQQDYEVPDLAYFKGGSFGVVNTTNGATLLANYEAAGGYGKYKLFFNDTTFSSPPQSVGGYVDWFSSWGPRWLDYNLKPSLAAPGGKILSTVPLGLNSKYGFKSGTSMATPYAAACYALLKSQFPTLSVAEITGLLQATAKPMQWLFDKSMVAGTFQQGAGHVNVYDAYRSQSLVTPGQLRINDVTHTEYGTANITIVNRGTTSQTYNFAHQGAAFSKYYLDFREVHQQPKYGEATLPSPVVVAPGASAVVKLSLTPPKDVIPSSLPVFGGYIKITSDADELSVPYAGVPFSPYNIDYIVINPTIPFPRLWYEFGDTRVEPNNSITVNSSIPYGSTVPRHYFTNQIRFDVLPANTTIVPHHYGFDKNANVSYEISKTPPRSSFVGFPSYGTLLNQTGIIHPGNSVSASGKGITVNAEDGTTYSPGPGGYRWLVSVLRWGGEGKVQEDWDTWLGPVINLVDGPV